MPCRSFRPLAGVNYNKKTDFFNVAAWSFRPLAGVNYNALWGLLKGQISLGFRPLAGVNYNRLSAPSITLRKKHRFRPLAGVNYNASFYYVRADLYKGFRPLAGVNYNDYEIWHSPQFTIGFRPLAGVNYNATPCSQYGCENWFPSPCGGEL